MTWRHPLPPFINLVLSAADAPRSSVPQDARGALSPQSGGERAKTRGAPGERDDRPERGSDALPTTDVAADSTATGLGGPAVESAPCPSPRCRERRDERRARELLYGTATRSGTVAHRGVRGGDQMTVQSDIPFGMSLTDWRADRDALRAA